MPTSPERTSLSVTLNANQRRHYGILLTGLETTLDKIETAIAEGPRASALGTVASDLPSPFRDRAPSLLLSPARHSAARSWWRS